MKESSVKLSEDEEIYMAYLKGYAGEFTATKKVAPFLGWVLGKGDRRDKVPVKSLERLLSDTRATMEQRKAVLDRSDNLKADVRKALTTQHHLDPDLQEMLNSVIDNYTVT